MEWWYAWQLGKKKRECTIQTIIILIIKKSKPSHFFVLFLVILVFRDCHDGVVFLTSSTRMQGTYCSQLIPA